MRYKTDSGFWCLYSSAIISQAIVLSLSPFVSLFAYQRLSKALPLRFDCRPLAIGRSGLFGTCLLASQNLRGARSHRRLQSSRGHFSLGSFGSFGSLFSEDGSCDCGRNSSLFLVQMASDAKSKFMTAPWMLLPFDSHQFTASETARKQSRYALS